MNASTTTLKISDRLGGGSDPFPPQPDDSDAPWHRTRHSAGSIALWVFIGVATALFSLFIAAYIMRMNASDWSPIGMPPQLWVSTALLIGTSILMQLAARPGRLSHAMLVGGGISALAFLAVQLWAWEALLDQRVMPAGNPAASFFYLLTAMHGLHAVGGLVAWGWTVRAMQHMVEADMQDAHNMHEMHNMRRRIALCARYWHFLLAVWIVLYATFTGLTPGIVAFICGR
jgi:cytochrome c oxidase subunit 3